MGYISELDADQEHEGWVAMTYPDGKISSGTSNGHGHYLDGYTYLPPDPETGIGGTIDPTFLRPFSDVSGWMPRCECGWQGIEVPVMETGTDMDKWREPSPDQEHLIMYQWRLHIREACKNG